MAFIKSLICFIALFETIAFAQHYQQYQYQLKPLVRLVRASEQNAAQARITASNNDYNPVDGSFSYGYQSENGISQQAKGYQNQNGEQVIEGSYSYYSPDGVPVSITYVADGNGFNAVGDAIPQPHPSIAKSVAYLRSLPPSAEDEQA